MYKKALIMLENGYYEYGNAFVGDGTIFGEFVFNTSMSGYEEIMTDPSYKGQVVVFTYPLIGNYGISRDDFQSTTVHSEAIIIRENSRISSNFRSKLTLSQILNEVGKIGIDGIDTRALTKQIRTKGAMKGGISSEHLDPILFLQKIKESESISDSNIFEKVISKDVRRFDGNNTKVKSIIAVDFGIKSNIIKELQRHFKEIYLVPFDNNFSDNISHIDFHGVFLSNGPGDPRVVRGIEDHIKGFVDAGIPITAICFGHQLIGKSFNLEIEKLPFGHHGGNHPVKAISNGKVYITAQNHNYAIAVDSIRNNPDWDLTWTNLYDGTVEGIKHKHLPINAVQFHPEASPGPNDANNKVFDEFFETITKGQ